MVAGCSLAGRLQYALSYVFNAQFTCVTVLLVIFTIFGADAARIPQQASLPFQGADLSQVVSNAGDTPATLASKLLDLLLSWPRQADVPTDPQKQVPVALHVFGDSYVDNGNRNESDEDAWCWKEPYGETWPGKPTGRCSDGRVLSDWLATFFNLSLPIPYRKLISQDSDKAGKIAAAEQGVNFAVAGSGVFRDFGYQTFRGQVKWLRDTVASGIIPQKSLADSYFLVSTSSNDYFNFVSEEQWTITLPTYIAEVVAGVSAGIEELYVIGARSFIVTNSMPLGCLPAVRRVVNATDCYKLGNVIASIHNVALAQAVTILRYKLGEAKIVVADLSKVFNNVGDNPDNYGFKSSFLACCDPKGGGISCGWHNVTYGICKDPSQNFFWDSFHLTEEGHHTVAQLFYEGEDYTDPKPNLRAVM